MYKVIFPVSPLNPQIIGCKSSIYSRFLFYTLNITYSFAAVTDIVTLCLDAISLLLTLKPNPYEDS